MNQESLGNKRFTVLAGETFPRVQSQAGQGLEQPGLVEVSLTMGDLRSLPTQPIPMIL